MASVSLLLTLSLPLIGYQSKTVRFVDVAQQAGIDFIHISSPEKRYIVESMSGGVALVDYDNDGWQDIYFVNSLTIDLVKSKGKTKSALTCRRAGVRQTMKSWLRYGGPGGIRTHDSRIKSPEL